MTEVGQLHALKAVRVKKSPTAILNGSVFLDDLLQQGITAIKQGNYDNISFHDLLSIYNAFFVRMFTYLCLEHETAINRTPRRGGV